jgi:hypothetical protein
MRNLQVSLGPQLLQSGEAFVTPDTGTRKVFSAFDVIEDELNRIGEALKLRHVDRRLWTCWYVNDWPSDELRAARNAIGHGEAALPNEAEVMKYRRQAEFLLRRLIVARHSIKNSGGEQAVDQED